MSTAIESMIEKLSTLLGTIDGKLRNKLSLSGGTVDHLTVTNQLSATADYAHALKVARLISLTGDATGSVSFDGSGHAAITVTVAELANKANQATTYTKTEVDTLFENLIGLAPEALDTIYELASALQENQDSIGTIITTLAAKANSDDVYDKAAADETFATLTNLQSTNDELSSVITQLTAAFVAGTEQINNA